MLNEALGVRSTEEGRSLVTTRTGPAGHVLYGPYDQIEPGSYYVEFFAALAEPVASWKDPLCLVLDVVRNVGSDVLARKDVRASHLQDGRTRFRLPFVVDTTSKLEYRAWTSGKAALLLDEYCRVVRVDDENGADAPGSDSFPEAADGPDFFRANRELFRSYYEQNIGVRIVDDAVVLTVDGVSLYARTSDDLNFVGEVFRENAYNFSASGDTCVIDIGMNIGLATLSFAAKPDVVEVHAFEPFPSTYERGAANVALNPRLFPKVSTYPFGLSDKNWSGDLLVADHGDSGAATVVANTGTVPVSIELRDAGEVLTPIVSAARRAGRRIVVKVDCEGSEFAVFESIERAGLLPMIDAFMVEWHAMFDDKNQHTLTGPLCRNGFIVFDRSPRIGNGFFYAAKLSG